MTPERVADRVQRPLKPARVAWGSRAAVVSPHHLASEAGLGVLRAGGNAVDAAVATNAALAVVASSNCGLGGDAFWLIWPGGADARLHALNGSGRSAAAATLEAARAAGLERMPVRGPWTVTVPGAIDSWREAHARFGRLPWADLLAPAVELADGWPASAAWAATIERGAAIYGTDGDWARTFRPHGRPLRPGEIVSLPALARTLRRLADDGPEDAYRGALAARAAEYLASRGSPLRAADFAAHRSDWGEAIGTDYRGVTATSHPPNSTGAIALELLNVLGRFPAPHPDEYTADGIADVRWIHLAVEAGRLTLADRDRLLTDLAAMAPEALRTLLDPAHAAALAARIDPERAHLREPAAVPAGGATVYLAAADRWGGVVSLIESNYIGFGSGLVDPETGIAYQNRGAFFVLDPAHPNALAPGKRTMHTLTPGMLLRDGLPWIAHGQMGGEIQPQVFAQFVSAVVDGGLDVAAALTLPRFAADHEEHYGSPVLTVLERRFPERIGGALEALGHRVEWAADFDSGLGHAHAVELVRDVAEDGSETVAFAAAADPRSEGAAATW